MQTKVIFAAVLLLIIPAWAQKDVPYGWHPVRQAELAPGADKDVLVHADFDGDGSPDTAQILADDAGRAMGIFAYLTSTSRWMKLDSDRPNEFKAERVAVVPAGSYQIACGNNASGADCAGGASDQLVLKLPGIELFSPAQRRLFYWDAATKSFKDAVLRR